MQSGKGPARAEKSFRWRSFFWTGRGCTRQPGKIPSKADYETIGKHSVTPLRERFGTWGQVPRYLRRYMEEQGLTEEWKDVMELIRAYEQGQDGMEMAPSPECEQNKTSI